MIPVAVYKVIHIIGIACVVGALGGMAVHAANGGTREASLTRRLTTATHGIGLLLIFLLLETIYVFLPISVVALVTQGSSDGALFLFATSILAVAAMVVPHGIFLARSGSKCFYSLAAPLGVAFAAYVAAGTLVSLVFRNGIIWRGTLYK